MQIKRSDTFEDFLEKCRLNGIETVYKPENTISLKFRMQGQRRFVRAKTLGYYYLPENIQRRIRQFSSHRKMILDRDKFDNRGLQYWADIQNMKNVSPDDKSALKCYNVHSTSELKPTTMTVMARRGMITQSIENLDKKINTLSEQIELVDNFNAVNRIMTSISPFQHGNKKNMQRKTLLYWRSTRALEVS